MKKVILSIVAVASLAGITCFLGVARGQGQAAAPAKSALPHKVGLIDMVLLFSKYKKFEDLRGDLKAELEDRDQKLKGMVERGKSLQGELKEFVPSSPEYLEREKQLTQLAASVEAEKRTMEREIQRKEAKMYQTIYLEVTDAVEKYARIYKYTLILKFNREDMTSDDPQKIAMALQRQVVYYQADDDITDPVLKYLNNTYEANATSAGKPAPRTGSRPAATSRN